MDNSDFNFLADLVKRRSGMVLSEDNAYLLQTRLQPVLRQCRMVAIDDLMQDLKQPDNENLARMVTEAMATNETMFFRDAEIFDQFQNMVLPRLIESRDETRSIRIWSAACASGQEPYSLAMILKEQFDEIEDWTTEIIATDLSSSLLEKARAGLYSQIEIQRGLPIKKLTRHFTQSGDQWEIDALLREMVHFGALNLMGDPSTVGKCDVIFCRNVLVYFDLPTKRKVLSGLASCLAEDGVLFLGSAETVLGVSELFKPLATGRGMYVHAASAEQSSA
ncbi:MAG TPA: chemotaxis protein CheR [Rhodospirillaceae bacterium]|nr:chemotaxis protein CheR [Rhodospirillaceae bacterium]HAA92494.1 chemotaxis protein CheR [Rhodospirillaceae bacterium]HAT35236.1 chemotaxis protein CheR [Rhodospirillaceae bacterium]|tara:strand:+ start:21 stop:854 length:834 start_codon:yes stop_codon:yes gene_type:complete